MGHAFHIKQGDSLPILTGTLEDENGAPLDLSTASRVLFKMRASGAAAPYISTACLFSTATAGGASPGHVTYTWAPAGADTATVGHHQGEFEVMYPASKTLTVPNPGFVPITVVDDMS